MLSPIVIPSPSTGPVLTAREAGAYLRLSQTSIWRAVKRGDLQPVKIAGRTLFRRADLDALIERCLVVS